MTDQTQSAVEAMADALDQNSIGGTSDRDLIALVQSYNLHMAQLCLTAFLAHLAASGWQIVPVVATEGMCRAWEAATNGSMSFENTNDEEVNNIFARMDYAAMLAAAPQFPGSEE